MKKERIISLISTGILLASTGLAGACKKDNKNNNTITPEENKKTQLEETGINLVENRSTEYKIVISEDKDTSSQYAANEFVEFMQLSTGVTFSVITDSGISYSADDKYIYIGETTPGKDAGVVATDDLGYSGYILKTLGNGLFIVGNTESNYCGSIYGVYDVLEKSIGYKFYASDEIVYERKTTVPLYNYNYTVKPSFNMVEYCYTSPKTNLALATRLRSKGTQGNPWASSTHTLISDFLPYSKYGTEHPDWYVNGGQQLCLSNEEMIEELISVVEERLDFYPERNYVMLGHEDNSTVCSCEKCTATANKYGGEFSGVELEFTTKVAKAVDKWLAVKYPERTVKYAFFAYGPTVNPPVGYNEDTGEFVLYNADTEVYANVGVYLAPIGYNFAKSPYDSENASLTRSMQGWSYLMNKQNLYMWNYSLLGYSYFFNCNNFGVIEEYYRFYNEIGVDYLFDQGPYDSNTPAFEELRLYVQSNLAWDISQSYNKLADDFMQQYYGLAYSAIKEYYDLIRAHYAHLDANNYATGTVFFLMDDKNLWSEGLVKSLLNKFEKAEKALEPLKETDPDRYDKLLSRVKKEKLSPIYMLLQYYIDDLSDAERTAYITEFKKYQAMFGINFSRESSNDVLNTISTWEKSS